MREYELTFVVQPEIGEEGREALIEKVRGALERGGATPLEVEDHGKRKLAYEIRDFQKGHYLTLHFLDTGKAVPDTERMLRLEESVLRYLTVMIEDVVADVEGRQARAKELEQQRKERAAERAAREAEERAAREAEAAEREAAEAKEREAAAAAEAEKAAEAEQAEPAPAEASAEGEAPAAEKPAESAESKGE